MNFNGWDLIGKRNLDYVADKILTNHTPKQMNGDSHCFDWIGMKEDEKSILDFGCGIGRNSLGMSAYSPTWKITGYDNSSMIGNTEEFAQERYGQGLGEFPNVNYSTDWDKLKETKFDVIWASIVFQHIMEDTLASYLDDIRSMTNTLIVAGRRSSDDDNKNTWEIMESNGYIPIKCNKQGEYAVDGDPNEHFACFYEW